MHNVICVCCMCDGVKLIIFMTVDEEEVEEEEEDDDSEIHTVVYFWQVTADQSSCVYHVTVVTVGTGCR